MNACANHPDATAVARCTRCRSTFCDGCIGFLVNADPWCEPCGNAMIDDGKGRPVLAAVVFVVLLAAFVALICVQIFVLERIRLYSFAFGIVPFVAAWRIAFPPTARPIVVDRNDPASRTPIPAAKRLN